MADSLSNVAVAVRYAGKARGHVVSLAIGSDFVWLDPAEAHQLARQLLDQATEAMHADRADRRG